jgi:phosphomannomutase
MVGKHKLIFSFSGIRGIAGKELNVEITKKIAIAFGLWFNEKEKRVIIGKDTRPSSEIIERSVIEGLLSTGFEVINVGICPTPVIMYSKRNTNIPAAIIITGSHNPQEWNGLKIVAHENYLNNNNLEKIFSIVDRIDLKSFPVSETQIQKSIKNVNPIPNYIKNLYRNIENVENVKNLNELRVVIDTGAGTGKFVTPQILRGLGCKVKEINSDFYINNAFPREIEPIEKNLKDLVMEVWQGKYDIGFAHDSDADRLAIIGENGVYYPEDISLALITDYIMKQYEEKSKEIIFITNLASSLMFDVLVDKYNAKIVRTPVGERFLIEEMNELLTNKKGYSKDVLIFGGEGSCGGVMFPLFNNTRDGIFAAAKIVEILVLTGQKLTKLVSALPKFYSYREKIDIEKKNIQLIIDQTEKELIEEGEIIQRFDNDLRFGKNYEWFVLIHPSNTEPVIRIISEAKLDSSARLYCEATAELIKLVIDRI